MRGEAPPHKNNLIGSAAGDVLKSVCLKLLQPLARLRTTWKLHWTLALNIRLRKRAKRIQDFVKPEHRRSSSLTTLSISTQNQATADRKEGFPSDVTQQQHEQSRRFPQQHEGNMWHPKQSIGDFRGNTRTPRGTRQKIRPA